MLGVAGRAQTDVVSVPSVVTARSPDWSSAATLITLRL